jgi:CO/xanthine dehydrogenase Mo-binding subunit
LKGQGPRPGRLARKRRFPEIGNDLVVEGQAKPKPPTTIIAEVEIDRRTGKIWARQFTVAHDCGLIINPDGLRRCIEGNVVQGTSRALSKEVAFDRARVTSTDWLSYPILDITEAPEAVDIVLLNRPDLPPARARSARSPPPSPTPFSTRPACACAARP